MHHRAGVETVFRAQDRLDDILVALLDRSLDDDVQVLGAAVALDDDLTGAEVADVERSPQFIDLVVAQTIERRVVTVERLRHRAPPSMERWPSIHWDTRPPTPVHHAHTKSVSQ